MKRLMPMPRRDHAAERARLTNERFALTQSGACVGWKEPISGLCWSLFTAEYLNDDSFYRYVAHNVCSLQDSGLVELTLKVKYIGQGALLRGRGEDPLEALVDALGLRFEMKFCGLYFAEFTDAVRYVAFVEISTLTSAASFGIGVHRNSTTAALLGVLIAVNRALKRGVLNDSMIVAAD